MIKGTDMKNFKPFLGGYRMYGEGLGPYSYSTLHLSLNT